jgi:hypothetical protein
MHSNNSYHCDINNYMHSNNSYCAVIQNYYIQLNCFLLTGNRQEVA